MSNKIGSFLIGFILVGAGILTAVLLMSRPEPAPEVAPVKVFSNDDIIKAQNLSSGLQNFGNLPFTVTGDQIGRSNPFDSY
jgi:hypothetical protein